MTIIVPKGTQRFDLLEIKEENFALLDTFSEDERFNAIQFLLDHYEELEVHKVIERLAKLSFQLNGVNFLAHCKFLAALLQEYVDKYDGMRLTMTYASGRESGLKHYKFSLNSTFIFNELFAIIENSSSSRPNHVALFARSIAINIWLPILSSRSQDLTFSPLTSERHDTLVRSMFMNNLDVHEAYITCFDTSLNSVKKTLWSLQLYGMKIDKAKAVIGTITKLHYQGAVEDYVLANILENTKHLLEGQISPEQYEDQSITMLYSDNSSLRTLGLLMMLLATAAACASILGFGIPLTVSVATSSALLGLMGFGLFHYSKSQPLFQSSKELLSNIQNLADDPEQTVGIREPVLRT